MMVFFFPSESGEAKSKSGIGEEYDVIYNRDFPHDGDPDAAKAPASIGALTPISEF